MAPLDVRCRHADEVITPPAGWQRTCGLRYSRVVLLMYHFSLLPTPTPRSTPQPPHSEGETLLYVVSEILLGKTLSHLLN